MPEEFSPITTVGNIHFKREDLYKLPNGVNGSKLRACEYLLERARRNGYRHVVTGSANVSPQHAIVASVARRNGMKITSVIGGSTLEKSLPLHRSLQIAYENGADFRECVLGFNPMLQKEAKRVAAELSAYYMPYGIAIEENATKRSYQEFHNRVAMQCGNLEEYEDLILPFGSGNTGVGVLWGLHRLARPPKRVHLMCIGPDRLPWATKRLEDIGVPGGLDGLRFELQVNILYKNFAGYLDKMPEKFGPINFHPTYEGKIIRYLKKTKPEYWTRRDGTTGFWIVGGLIK